MLHDTHNLFSSTGDDKPVNSSAQSGKKTYSTPELIVHGDMRAITHAIIGGSFNDGTFTGTVDGEPGFS